MIDWNQVIDLHDRLGPAELAPTINTVLARIESHLFALDTRTPYSAEDLLALRGLAQDIGFTEFYAHCLRIEEQLARGSQSALGPAVLRASFGHTKKLFLRDLPNVLDRDQNGNAAAQAS